MESIDPELRGSPQPEAPSTTATKDGYSFSEAQNAVSTNGSSANGTDQITQQTAQALAADGLPYFNAPLPDLSAQATYQPINFTPHEIKRRPRSCESCRGLKVKCEPSGEGSCKRCLKAGRECNYTESSGRRKKKQDNKVAELEKQVSGLTAALLAQRGAEASDSLVFDENSILQTNSTEGGISNGKRRRSEYEQEDDTSSLRPAKHQALAPAFIGSLAHSIDSQALNSLAGEPLLQTFCASLKSLESWLAEHTKSNNVELSQDVAKSNVNGNDNIKDESPSNSSIETKANAKKNAPTAPMGRTPLDLLSQVASNENPSASPQGQDVNQWYSPYAKANQDTSGYYSDSKQEDKKLIGGIDDLNRVLQTEFGNRASLVMSFLGTFFATSSAVDTKNGDNG